MHFKTETLDFNKYCKENLISILPERINENLTCLF